MQNNNKNKQNLAWERPVDNVIKESAGKMGAMALISHTQVKLWKAMLFSFFFAGFVGALVFVTAFKLGLGTKAAWNAENSINIASSSQIRASSYTRAGYGPENLINNSQEMMMMRLGGTPWVILDLPGEKPRKIVKVSIKLDPTVDPYRLCGLHDFSLMYSIDGKNFAPILKSIKNNNSDWQDYLIDNGRGIEAKALKLVAESNWGDPAWLCVQDMKVAAM